NVATNPFANVTSGDLIVVWIWYNSNAQSVSGVTDSAGGNNYLPAIGPTAGSGTLAGWQQEIWYAKITNGGAGVVVTAKFTGTFATEKAISAHRYQAGTTLDQVAANTGTSANATCGPKTVTANELVFAAAIFGSSGSPDPAFTPRSALGSNVAEDKFD